MFFPVLVQEPFERFEALLLVERDGEQNRFHRVVVALIGGRLGVRAHAAEQPVEVLLVVTPQRPPELGPARRRLINQLPKRRDRAPHQLPQRNSWPGLWYHQQRFPFQVPQQ